MAKGVKLNLDHIFFLLLKEGLSQNDLVYGGFPILTVQGWMTSHWNLPQFSVCFKGHISCPSGGKFMVREARIGHWMTKATG